MNLRVLLPSRVFAEKADVLRIVVETRAGSLGLLPHRLDCVAPLVPGILTYEAKGDATAYIAVDEGVLVKAGADVLVSVRHAIGGSDLRGLTDVVKREFLDRSERERGDRAAASRMEAGLVRRLLEFTHVP